MGIGPSFGARQRRLSLALACLVLPTGAFAATCDEGRVELRGDGSRAAFSVEVADEPEERSIGLMNRPAMPTGAGMLFVYERPQRAVFWMRNTLIPLDMIFMDETGRVTHVHPEAVPLDETGIDGGDDVKFVLEINGGLAERLGIEEGHEMRHPRIGDDAAWPCDG